MLPRFLPDHSCYPPAALPNDIRIDASQGLYER